MALSRGSRRFLVVLAILALVGVGGAMGSLWWIDRQLAGDPGPGDPVSFEVASGASAASVGQDLAEAAVIRNALAFRLVARSRGLDSALQAGTYELETGMSVDEAIDVLLAGPARPDAYRFTVQEGLSVDQTLARLAEQTPWSVAEYRALLDARLDAGGNAEGLLRVPEAVPPLDEFGPEVREPFEGLLFPETYEVFAEATAQEILQRMLDQLDRVLASIPDDQVAGASERGLSVYEVMVAASLIERETKVDAERATVAGVIANRLDIGMLLQIDATCLYAIDEQKERVLQADCEVASPYNTYYTAGLPPTPISGMGRAALEAAFAPESHDFLYYVLTPACDGTHAFATSLSEHNANVRAFRAGGSCGVS